MKKSQLRHIIKESIKELVKEQAGTTNYWRVFSEMCDTSAMGPYQCINFPAGVTPQPGDVYLTPTGWTASGGGGMGITYDNQTMFIWMVMNQGCTPFATSPTAVVSMANNSSCPRCCHQEYWHTNMGAVPGGACWNACRRKDEVCCLTGVSGQGQCMAVPAGTCTQANLGTGYGGGPFATMADCQASGCEGGGNNPCETFYSLPQAQQDGCCQKCQGNISPQDPCYQYCDCCPEDPPSEMVKCACCDKDGLPMSMQQMVPANPGCTGAENTYYAGLGVTNCALHQASGGLGPKCKKPPVGNPDMPNLMFERFQKIANIR